MLERVMQRTAERLAAGHHPSFTVSFGLASSDQAAEFHQVVALADEALLAGEVRRSQRDRHSGSGQERDSTDHTDHSVGCIVTTPAPAAANGMKLCDSTVHFRTRSLALGHVSAEWFMRITYWARENL